LFAEMFDGPINKCQQLFSGANNNNFAIAGSILFQAALGDGLLCGSISLLDGAINEGCDISCSSVRVIL
jgi:hypothetical protein